jgi:uncharacterized protein YeaC (DUF1315 family)
MNFEDAAESIPQEIYEQFKKAIELGKWPDGRVLTREQKEICLQAIMLYEARHGVDEKQRTGYIDREKKTSPCGPKDDSDDESAIRILH